MELTAGTPNLSRAVITHAQMFILHVAKMATGGSGNVPSTSSSSVVLCCGIPLVKKRNTSSVVWEYFGLKASQNGTLVASETHLPVCRLCGKSVPAKGGNTTNLLTHLRDRHPDVYADAQPKVAKKGAASTVPTIASKQPTLQQSVERTSKYPAQSAIAQELNHAVTYFLAKDVHPLHTVDKLGFRQLVFKLNPRYQLPSRKHFTEYEVPKLYNHVRDFVVKPTITEAKHFSATTDLWTSAATVPFMTVTIHFIDNEWVLRSYCLSTFPLYEDHTGQNLADAITDVLANWDLRADQIVATTTDNASNIIAAFNLLGMLRLSCFGHNLDLAINRGLQVDRVKRALGKCHSLVELFHRSWKKTRDLRLKQEALSLPQHKLIVSVATRWGSTYDMVARIIEQQQAICAVLAEDRKNWHRMPSDADFSVLETIYTVLKPLSTLTDALSGEKQVTISAIRPVLKHVQDCLTVSTADGVLATQMKTAISTDLNRRNNSPELGSLIDKASFLDPRFRDQYVEDKDATIDGVKSECLPFATASAAVGASLVGAAETGSVSENPPPTKKAKVLAAVLSNICSTSQEQTPLTPLQTIENEIASYKNFPKTTPDTDPLVWWKGEGGRFPNLAHLAQKYLTVCGTSVPSERIFSRAGCVTNHRYRLSPENVDRLVFLANNMQ